MEEGRRKDYSMDIDQPEHAPTSNSALGSPSYSPPQLMDCTEEEEEATSDGDEAEQEETEEARAARRKAKAKGRASSLPEDDEENDRRPYAYPPRIAAQDIDVDVDNYWAREALQLVSRPSSAGPKHEPHFGDADAAMNDALVGQSPSPPENIDNDTAPAVRDSPPERPQIERPDRSSLTKRLFEMQKQQFGDAGGRGRGRGRGIGLGWGLTWQETVMRPEVENKGWGGGNHPSSPEEQEEEETGWEVYDHSVWERAGEEEEARRLVATLKVPRSSGSVDGGELVRAVRGYRAILTGNYLSYAKDDVLRVIHRDGDGKLFTLLPLQDGAFSGRAHTKDFVPANQVAEDQGSGSQAEEDEG